MQYLQQFHLFVSRLARRWQDAGRRHPRAAVAAISAAALVAVLSLGGGIWYLSSLLSTLPDEDAIARIGEMDQATAVYDSSDALAFTIFREQRIDVPLEQMSPHLLAAILAIEDQRFYRHRGFDAIRIVSAALANVRHLRVAQGGSTITQQLARQSFLTPDKTLRRKLQELILAGRLEREYSKATILEMYLNKVYFGNGLYGVEAASRGYFDKHASELSLSEAALLAGLVKSPSSYAPTVSLERATARRNVVLAVMLEQGGLDRDTWESARAEPIALVDGLRADEPHGRYFKEQVRRELVDRFGWERVYQGGLRVFTTVDMRLQEAAEAAVEEGLAALDARQRALASRRKRAAPAPPAPPATNDEPLQAALVALDPQTGEVRAMVGGRDFEASPFNRAVQARRQPGSAFKPFVYAAALEAGFTPATMITDLNEPIPTFEGDWTPDDEHSTAEQLSLRAALRTSSNRAAVRLLQDVGIEETVSYAKALGVGDVPGVPSLALGSGEVTLESLTAAYAAFANRGRVPRPLLIRRVEDRDGLVLFAAEEPSAVQAVSETTAYLMSSMLADVLDAGTAYRARTLGFTLPAAGKTGTTNDFKDAWFVGFTPSLVAGVWIGFDQPRTILPNGFAADVAVPLWTAFMKEATKGDAREWPRPPAGVTTANVCRLSGLLASEGCREVDVVNAEGQIERRSMIYTEYFARGSVPTATCDLHRSRGLMVALSALFRRADHLPTPRLEDTGLPVVQVRPPDPLPVQPPAAAASNEDPQKNRRGFWSRLFGRGRDARDDERDEVPEK